jgi:hypothetical protein
MQYPNGGISHDLVKKTRWGARKKKSSRTKNDIKAEKGKEKKINLPTTLVNTRTQKNRISAPSI